MTYRFVLSGDPTIVDYLIGELDMYRDHYLERPFPAVLRNFLGKDEYFDDFTTCSPVYAGHHATEDGLVLALQVTNTNHDHVMMLLNTITGLACDSLRAQTDRIAEIHEEWSQKTTPSAVIQLYDPNDRVYSVTELIVRANGITFTLMPLWMTKTHDKVIWEEWHTQDPNMELVFLDMVDRITEIVSITAIDKKGHAVKDFTVRDVTFYTPKPHDIPKYVVEAYNNDPFRKVADRAVDRLRAHVDKQFSELSVRLADESLKCTYSPTLTKDERDLLVSILQYYADSHCSEQQSTPVKELINKFK